MPKAAWKKSLLPASIVLFFMCQIAFWWRVQSVKPKLDIVSEPPTMVMVEMFSLGDRQFYFRANSFKIQNFGDTFGRFTPLKSYDYGKLQRWFMLLDDLDSQSNYVTSLAAYYYSNSQNTEDVKYVVDFLEYHADKNPAANWWWYYQASYLSTYLLQDKDRGVDLARKLAENAGPDAPEWSRRLVAVMLAEKGENCEALRLVNSLMDTYDGVDPSTLPEREQTQLEYMRYFIMMQIEKLRANNFDPRDCLGF